MKRLHFLRRVCNFVWTLGLHEIIKTLIHTGLRCGLKRNNTSKSSTRVFATLVQFVGNFLAAQLVGWFILRVHWILIYFFTGYSKLSWLSVLWKDRGCCCFLAFAIWGNTAVARRRRDRSDWVLMNWMLLHWRLTEWRSDVFQVWRIYNILIRLFRTLFFTMCFLFSLRLIFLFKIIILTFIFQIWII